MPGRCCSPPIVTRWPIAPGDLLAGGSWLGVNDHGVVAGILNRPGALGPAPGKRSRGELVLEALDHADAVAAAAALIQLDTDAYRPFNLVVADDRDAYWLRHDNTGRIEELAVPDGVSILTSNDLNDLSSARIRRYLPRFEAARTPDPDAGDWTDWQHLMESRMSEQGAGPRGALNIVTDGPYGTVSSSLIAIPEFAPAHIGAPPRKPVWLFAAGRPGTVPYQPVEI
jgi:hypothetical protein